MVATMDNPFSLDAAALSKSAQKSCFDSIEAFKSSKAIEIMFVPARNDDCWPNVGKARSRNKTTRAGRVFMLRELSWLDYGTALDVFVNERTLMEAWACYVVE